MLEIELVLEKLKNIEQLIIHQKRILNIDDLAILTGWSKSHIYKLTSTNRIPHYKPGGKTIYFDREEVEEFILSHRVNTVEEIKAKANAFIFARKRKKN
ncbi:MAG: helix-turn-helix domain-containing protein [Microscillaceae bacterium]|nr:helix-turn-helix domain-containing protein [Microscillaceae bacterium]